MLKTQPHVVMSPEARILDLVAEWNRENLSRRQKRELLKFLLSSLTPGPVVRLTTRAQRDRDAEAVRIVVAYLED